MAERQVYQKSFNQVAQVDRSAERQAIGNLVANTADVLIQHQVNQDKLKITNYSSQSDLEILEETNRYRAENALNPNDKESYDKHLQAVDKIYAKYDKEIGISAKGQWNKTKDLLKFNQKDAHVKWAIAQNVKNGEANLKSAIDASVKKSFLSGLTGDFETAIDDIGIKEAQLISNAQSLNLPADQIKEDMKNFRSDSVKNFVLGSLESSPEKAESLLADHRVIDTIDSPDAVDDLRKAIDTKHEELLNVSAKTQYDYSVSFDESSKSMNFGEQLVEIERGIASGEADRDWAKARKDRILSAAGVTAKTQNDEFDKLGQRISDINATYNAKEDYDSARDFLKNSTAISAAIDKAVTEAKISPKSADKLQNRLTSETQSKATENLSGKSSPWGYGMNNARNKFKNSLHDPTRVAEASRKYFEKTEDGKEAFSGKTKQEYKDIADSIVEEFNEVFKSSDTDKKEVKVDQKLVDNTNAFLDSLGAN